MCHFHQKVWATRQSISSYRNCQPEPSRNSPSLQETISRCRQVWNNSEQLHCVANSTLVVRMTKVLLISLGTCFVQIQSVRVNFACTKWLFNPSAEAFLNFGNARLCVRCALFFLKLKQFLLLVVRPRNLRFRRESTSIHYDFVVVYSPGKYWLNKEKSNSSDGYVTTPGSNYGCGNCGASLFV